MNIKIAGVIPESIVDGKGIRLVVFTQGCNHKCVGCHNESSHDLQGGFEQDISSIQELMHCNPLLTGITLSGGEPFLQEEACIELCKFAHSQNLDVWCYTGFTFEQLKDSPLLKEVDVLVDGKFEIDLKTLDTPFIGSSNQRVINVSASLKNDKVILL